MLYAVIVILLAVIAYLSVRVSQLNKECEAVGVANARLLIELTEAYGRLQEANTELQTIKAKPIKRGAHMLL